MDSEDRIARLVDDATMGLKDDSELRLDVRAELASHIEEAVAAHEVEGKSGEEALELALKAFGPVADVAAGLVAANRRRMKLRALARLGARALLVPAAVVVALVVCARFVPLRGALGMLGVLSGDCAGGAGADLTMERVASGLPEEDRFLFRGDASRPTEAQRQRAIWERHPDETLWFGNYVSHLLAEREHTSTTVTPEEMERELRRGEEIEPANARYNVVLAGLWAERAASLEVEREVEKPDGTQETWFKLVVKDRELLDRAMAELVKGAAKPYYRTYHQQVFLRRLRLLSPVLRFEDEIARIAWAASLLLPDCSLQRDVARKAALYGKLLVAEGRAAEGERCLDAWYPLALKYHEDAFTLIEVLVANAVVSVGRQYGAAAYEEAGLPGKAGLTVARAERLSEPFEIYRQRRKTGWSGEMARRLERSGSVLDKMLMPVLDPEVVRDIDLGASRRLEHVLVEQAGVSLYLLLLIGLMGLCVAATLRWRWARGMAAAPLLLLPGWRTMLRILVLGVLVPLVAFYGYTRWSGVAGREFGFTYLVHRFVLELVLLGVTIALLARSMAVGAIRRRCESLGIAVPPARRWRAVALWATLAVLWAVCLTLRQGMGGPGWTGSPLLWAVAAVGIGAIVLAVHFVFGRRGYGLYCGTVARSLIPVFAAALLVVAAVAHPCLRSREVRWLQAQTGLSAKDGIVGFTRAEALMVERLRAGVQRAARELDAGL